MENLVGLAVPSDAGEGTLAARSWCLRKVQTGRVFDDEASVTNEGSFGWDIAGTETLVAANIECWISLGDVKGLSLRPLDGIYFLSTQVNLPRSLDQTEGDGFTSPSLNEIGVGRLTSLSGIVYVNQPSTSKSIII